MRPKIKVVGHAVQGRGHAIKNIVCQDKVYAHRFKDKRSAFVALADGAGSCSHSHLGAEYVVTETGGFIYETFDNFFNNPKTASFDLVNRLQEGLNCLALHKKVEYNSLSSTLLFVCARRYKKITKYIVGHIGDGTIGILENDRLKVLSHPENGEFANSTFFITSSSAIAHFRVYVGTLKGNAGFLLLSDGAAESLYNKSSDVLAPACKKILSWFIIFPQRKVMKAIKKNLEKVFRFYTFDDCSIAAMGVTGIERVRRGKRKK